MHLTLGGARHTHSSCQLACYRMRWWALTGSSLLFLGCDWTMGQGRPSRSRNGTRGGAKGNINYLQSFHTPPPLTLEQVM